MPEVGSIGAFDIEHPNESNGRRGSNRSGSGDPDCPNGCAIVGGLVGLVVIGAIAAFVVSNSWNKANPAPAIPVSADDNAPPAEAQYLLHHELRAKDQCNYDRRGLNRTDDNDTVRRNDGDMDEFRIKRQAERDNQCQEGLICAKVGVKRIGVKALNPCEYYCCSEKAEGHKTAFVFIGATGDNANRKDGVWSGLFEAYRAGWLKDVEILVNYWQQDQKWKDLEHKLFDTKVGGVFGTRGTLVQHEEDLKEKDEGQREISNQGKKAHDFKGKINPFTIEPADGQTSKQAKEAFKAEQAKDDPKGRNVAFQARHMADDLTPYSKIVIYLSIPPPAYVEWVNAVMTQWVTGQKGKDRIHILLEKPFGQSETTAKDLRDKIAEHGVDTSTHLHLVDHFKSFFMFRQWATWQPYVDNLMNIKWNKDDQGEKAIKKIVVKQFEERGLEGRGRFFDGTGQVRDMVQSHLLQVLLQVMDPTATSAERTEILRSLTIKSATYGQYNGFLDEKGLKWHEDFATPTLCRVEFTSSRDIWKDVALVIETGKDFNTEGTDTKGNPKGKDGNMYDVEIYLDKQETAGQAEEQVEPDLTYQYGVEETGTARIKVRDISLVDYGRLQQDDDFKVPLPVINEQTPSTTQPNLPHAQGEGKATLFTYYTDPASCKENTDYNHCGYYPGAYAMMTHAAVKGEWEAGFVTYEECDASWKLLQGDGTKNILNPAPDEVFVYKPPETCKATNPVKECYDETKKTVKDLYNDEFACKNQVKRSQTDLWKSHCENKETGTNLLVEGSGGYWLLA